MANAPDLRRAAIGEFECVMRFPDVTWSGDVKARRRTFVCELRAFGRRHRGPGVAVEAHEVLRVGADGIDLVRPATTNVRGPAGPRARPPPADAARGVPGAVGGR